MGSHQIVMPRRGVFQIHWHDRSIVADANTAVLLPVGAEYRVSHPAKGGDDSFVLALAPELVDEAFGGDGWRYGIVRTFPQLGASVLRAALRRRVLDGLEAEEAALRLVGELASGLHPATAPETPRGHRAAARHATAAKLLLASYPTRAWRVATIAHAVGCSPFHLARRYKEVTGLSIHTYLVRLRLALALQRVAEGETDLARLAADLGFAHHSHLTATFHRAFGLTPSAVRSALAGGEELGALLSGRELTRER